MSLPRFKNGRLSVYAWPGGYPLLYLSRKDCGVYCPDCANDLERRYRLELMDDFCNWVADPDFEPAVGSVEWSELPQSADINWEDSWMYCDYCNERIESAYCEDSADV